MGEDHVPHGQTVSRTRFFLCVSPMAPDGVFLSHLQAGRNSTELLNLTITEISSTKPRRANRNSQGSQRSWVQGTECNKTNKRDRRNEPLEPVSQQPNDQSINRLIDRSISQSINDGSIRQSINRLMNQSSSIQAKTAKNKAYQQTAIYKTICKQENNQASNKTSYR